MHTKEFISSPFTISGTDDTDNKNNSSVIEAAEKATNDNNIHTFAFIYMDGCGHCEDTEDAWLAFMKNHATHDNVEMFAVNHDALSEIKSIMGKESPNAFPTLYHVYSGKVAEYSGNRSLDGLNKWLAESVATVSVGGRRRKSSSRRKRTERRKRRRGNSKRYKKKTMRHRHHNRK